MPIWNPPAETMPRQQLEQLQLERLQAVLNRIWESVPFYRRKFEELGLMPEHIRSLDDLRLLPFTAKEDLRTGYPYDLFALPLREVVRIHASSGATGPPTVVGYTKNDLRNWGELVARVSVSIKEPRKSAHPSSRFQPERRSTRSKSCETSVARRLSAPLLTPFG